MSDVVRASTTPVLIVGAGPTGLVLALWLTRLGVQVRIVDKAAQPGTTSRAVGVQARTLELYRQLGLADELVSAGVVVSALRLWVGGKPVARVPFGHIGEGISPYPYLLTYPQDEHERLLIARLERVGVQVEREVELVALEQDAACARATLRTRDGSTETVEARYVAGCDGAHSRVRQAINATFPGGTYGQLFYVADVTASGNAISDEIHVDLDASDLLAVFPLKGTGRARLIGTIRSAAAARDEPHTFADVSDRALRSLQMKVAEVRWFSTYRVHHRVATHFHSGRAFLLGDAAHIHSPVGGQGMNTGIGDAVNLAWKLAAVVNGDAAEALLASYEIERIAFARRLVSTTDRAFTLATRQGRVAEWVRTRVVPVLAPLLLRTGVMRRFMFRTISQTGIQYRGSPLSERGASALRGGDRLPWVPGAAGEDNFAPLVSLAWQVHVYGSATPGVREACSALHLALHEMAWSAHAERAGLVRDASYLVRPDGYVAAVRERRESGDAGWLAHYFSERGLAPGS